MNLLKELLYWTWCLPQTLLGLILKLIFKGKKHVLEDYETGKNYVYYRYNCNLGSISLGKYIMICDGHYGDIETVKHEYGHFKQSLILGWLFLLVIGLPSLCWAGFGQDLLNKITEKHYSYYWFYTESWANKLGRVKKRK